MSTDLVFSFMSSGRALYPSLIREEVFTLEFVEIQARKD